MKVVTRRLHLWGHSEPTLLGYCNNRIAEQAVFHAFMNASTENPQMVNSPKDFSIVGNLTGFYRPLDFYYSFEKSEVLQYFLIQRRRRLFDDRVPAALAHR